MSVKHRDRNKVVEKPATVESEQAKANSFSLGQRPCRKFLHPELIPPVKAFTEEPRVVSVFLLIPYSVKVTFETVITLLSSLVEVLTNFMSKSEKWKCQKGKVYGHGPSY